MILHKAVESIGGSDVSGDLERGRGAIKQKQKGDFLLGRTISKKLLHLT